MTDERRLPGEDFWRVTAPATLLPPDPDEPVDPAAALRLLGAPPGAAGGEAALAVLGGLYQALVADPGA